MQHVSRKNCEARVPASLKSDLLACSVELHKMNKTLSFQYIHVLKPVCSSFSNVYKIEFFAVMESVSLSFIDLEWKIIYVGSAETEDYDQTLDTVMVGPVSAGRHMFVFQVLYSNLMQWLDCIYSIQ